MSRLIPLALLLLTGCPDPTTAPAADLTDPGSGEGAPPPADGATGAAGPGDNQHTVDATVTPGEGVTVSGTISYAGEKTGRVRIDVLTERGNNPHLLAKTLELPSLGDWSIELPKEFGTVNVVGFLDQTGDGPTPDDPAMALQTPVEVGLEDIEGLALELSDDPELGALTPSSPPPEPDGSDQPSGDPAAAQGPADTPPEGHPEGEPVDGQPEGEPEPAPEGAPTEPGEAPAEPAAAEAQPDGATP